MYIFVHKGFRIIDVIGQFDKFIKLNAGKILINGIINEMNNLPTLSL